MTVIAAIKSMDAINHITVSEGAHRVVEAKQ